MSLYFARRYAAPVMGAAFLLFASQVFPQAPIIDASGASSTPRAAPAQEAGDTGSQGELFYQLQLLRQEVMELRGVVEQQGHELRQLKQQSLDRYLDLDKRLSNAGSGRVSNAEQSAAVVVPGVSPAADAQSMPVQPGEYEAYRDAYKLVKDQQFELAIPAFQRFLKSYPVGQYAPNALYWLGELYLVQSPPALEPARQQFTQLLEQYPGHSKQPDAMYKLGRVYFLTGDKPRAKQLLEQVVADYESTGSSAAKLASQFLQQNF